MSKWWIAVVAAGALAVGGVAVASSSDSEPRSIRVAEADDATPVTTTVVEATTTVPDVGAAAGTETTAAPGEAPPQGAPQSGTQTAPADTGGTPAPDVPAAPPAEQPAAPEPPRCTIAIDGPAVTKANCADITTMTVRWYYQCQPGTDLPFVLPSGRTISTCPTLIADVPVGFGADRVGVGAAVADANCFEVYLPELGVFRGSCQT